MITDTECVNAAGRIEDCYAHHLPAPASRITCVDPLGYGRWLTEYQALRATGLLHEPAINEIERRIHAIALPLPPPVPGVHPNPLIGRLRLVDGIYADDTGSVNPVAIHTGDLFALYVRDPLKALGEMDKIGGAGHQLVRVWMNLGYPPFWTGWETDPHRTPDYWGQAQGFMAALSRRGVQLVWSCGDYTFIGPTMTDRIAYAQTLARLPIQPAFLDAGNESWHPVHGNDLYRDPANMARFIAAYKSAGGTALCSLSSPPGTTKAEIDAYSADIFDVHTQRDNHSWDKRRYVMGATYQDNGPKPDRHVGINSEGPGEGPLVSASDFKEELDNEAMGTLCAAALISRQAYVLFGSEGIKLQRGIETMTGFANVRKLAQMFPRNIMRHGGVLHHCGVEAGGSIRVLSCGAPQVRCGGVMHTDGSFAYVLDGPPGDYQWVVERSFDGTVIHPGTCEAQPVSRRAGDLRHLTWQRGRVLIGKVRP